jgi:hypothetical protein
VFIAFLGKIETAYEMNVAGRDFHPAPTGRHVIDTFLESESGLTSFTRCAFVGKR